MVAKTSFCRMDAINELIKRKLVDKDLNVSKLARLCETTPQNMSKKLNKPDIEVFWLMKISKALQYNFFDDLSRQLKEIGVPTLSKVENTTIDELIERKIQKALSKVK